MATEAKSAFTVAELLPQEAAWRQLLMMHESGGRRRVKAVPGGDEASAPLSIFSGCVRVGLVERCRVENCLRTGEVVRRRERQAAVPRSCSCRSMSDDLR